MIRYLFVDNFRGFTNTFIPIVDVNFFVGENSSGKTSVLSLIKLLSTQEFLWGQKFSNKEINFGHFHDIVSAHSRNRSYFTIGLIEALHGDPTAMIFTFTEHEGLARLASFAATLKGRQIFLRFDGRKVYFKITPLSHQSTVESLKLTTMPRWVEERFSDISSYQEVRDMSGYPGPGQRPLYIFLMMAMQASPEDVGEMPPLLFPRSDLIWIAPIRTQPERTYDDISQSDFSSEGAHTPYLIGRVLQSGFESAKFDDFLRRTGHSSGLFESIQINRFGDTVTAPFEVDAVLDGKPLNLINVGYGVSQSLPVFVEIFTRPRDSWFAIQQPEVHLHPRAQAALGDAFFEMAVVDGKHFLVETHSDFTIDRFRMNYRKGGRKPTSQVLFFERKEKQNTVTPLAVSKNGEMPPDQPDGYRRFFLKEEMRLLGL